MFTVSPLVNKEELFSGVADRESADGASVNRERTESTSSSKTEAEK